LGSLALEEGQEESFMKKTSHIVLVIVVLTFIVAWFGPWAKA
jgi:hypothetical protein